MRQKYEADSNRTCSITDRKGNRQAEIDRNRIKKKNVARQRDRIEN